MSAREREHGELPSPNLSPFSRKAGRGLFVSESLLEKFHGCDLQTATEKKLAAECQLDQTFTRWLNQQTNKRRSLWAEFTIISWKRWVTRRWSN
jgi:hypothetical protein